MGGPEPRIECVDCASPDVTGQQYRTAQNYQRFYCCGCGRRFNERSSRALNSAPCPSDVIALVVPWRLRDRLPLRNLA